MVNRVRTHVRHLVGNALVRFHPNDFQSGSQPFKDRDYYPVSEISTQISLIPTAHDLRRKVFEELLTQFSAFASDDRLASSPRMLDIVYAILINDSYLCQTDNEASHHSLQSFLKTVCQSGPRLSSIQKQHLLELMNFSHLKHEKNKGVHHKDVNVFSENYSTLETTVGFKEISQFLASQQNTSKTSNLFLRGLEDRIKLALSIFDEKDLNRSEVHRDFPEELVVLKEFRTDPKAFFLNKDVVDHLTTLHEMFPVDFKRATAEFLKLFDRNNNVFQSFLDTIFHPLKHDSGKPDLSQKYLMMHDFLTAIHHDYHHLHALRNFFKDAVQRCYGTHLFDCDALFSDYRFIDFLTLKASNSNDLTDFQSLIVQQFQVAFFNREQTVENLFAQQTLFSSLMPIITPLSLEKFIQSVVSSSDSLRSDVSNTTRWEMLSKLMTSVNNNSASRSQRSRFVQFVIHQIVNVNTILDADRSPVFYKLFNGLTPHQQDQLAAEFSHYFKAGGKLSTPFSRMIMDSSTSIDSDNHHELLVKITKQSCDAFIKSIEKNERMIDFNSLTDQEKADYHQNYRHLNMTQLVLAHFLVGLPEHQNLETALFGAHHFNHDIYLQFNKVISVMDPSMRAQFLSRCESLISSAQLDKLKTEVSMLPDDVNGLKDFVQEISLAGGRQINMRNQLVQKNKVEKIKQANRPKDLYFWTSALRAYAKYARQFEIERTKTLSVSHVSSSLSV